MDNDIINRERSKVNQNVKSEMSEVVNGQSKERPSNVTAENRMTKKKLEIQDLDPAIIAVCTGKSTFFLEKYCTLDKNTLN